MHVKLGKTVLEIRQEHFNTALCEALVFPANNYFWMGSDITNAIKKQAGSVVEKEAMQMGPVELGASVITSAGNLPYECLIHVACSGQDGRILEEYITPCTNGALEQAESKRVLSVAIIPFITEHAHISPYTVAENMIRSIIDYCLGKTAFKRIVILAEDEDLHTVFNNMLAKIFSSK
ncbi:MAG: macro domain-containing protein [Candidatus Auribacterota bacterium]|jgi:O-acetyl-ADP-ribose deacetylase (regulator of RNase III)|nr:macro domain-containing protein [Candidatus Auribacterota bacterium]